MAAGGVTQSDTPHLRRGPWAAYVLQDYPFIAFTHAAHLLDIGCGFGEQLRAFHENGLKSIGLDRNRATLAYCQRFTSALVEALAEHLPFRSESLDGIICKTVVPYTDERLSLSEIARVLKPRGEARLCFHGSGYYVRYLLCGGDTWKHRVYGLRAIVNTWVYWLARVQLPGFLGDTLHQSPRHLRRQYRALRLELIDKTPSPTFLGLPVFIYHLVRKTELT